MSGVHIIWFRRDLRVHDHAALAAAAASGGRVIPLYIFEPGDWSQSEHSRRHFDFVSEALKELHTALQLRGAGLTVRTGNAIDVFAEIHRRYGISAIHMHAETGLPGASAQRQSVTRWARNAGISLREQPQNGILKGNVLQGRWADHWQNFMSRPRITAPETLPAMEIPAGEFPLAGDFRLGPDDCPHRQRGMRAIGVESLRQFLDGRLPSSLDIDSILSPHLAFGTVSVREAWQAARRARETCNLNGDAAQATLIGNFMSRLQWRCHCIQKFDDLTATARQYPGPAAGSANAPLNSSAGNDDPRLIAWIEGRTGFPLLDACMRSLRETGWLSFKMRSAVMAFAAHHLWLGWEVFSGRLAPLLTDFEAGVLYTQARLEATFAGPGSPEITNPVQQSQELDPEGRFIRRWLPELSALPAEWLHAPWEAPGGVLSNCGIVLGQTYPMRIIDHVAAADTARARILSIRREVAQARRIAKIENGRAFGSSGALRAVKAKKPSDRAQLSFDLSAEDTPAARAI